MFEWSTNDPLTYKHVTHVVVRTILWCVDKSLNTNIYFLPVHFEILFQDWVSICDVFGIVA
jgi:hypothetical protein